MRRTMKKIFAVLLTMTMLFAITPVSAATVVEGDNGKTICLSMEFYDEDAAEKITEVSSGECFTIHLNFSDNPSVLDDSLHGYQLLINYDADKMMPDGYFEGVLNAPLVLEPAFANGVALVQGVAADGITKRGAVITEGTLFYMYVEAKADLTQKDLEAISLIASGGGKEAYVLDGNIPAGTFTIAQPGEEHVHTYGAWEKADDTTHKKTCECGDVITEAHKWDDGIVTEGAKTYTCTECGATYTETVVVPDPEPVPGDGTCIAVGNITTRRGKEIVVPVTISNNVGLAGLQMTCNYDAPLILTNIETGDALSDLTFTRQGGELSNGLKLTWDGQDADNSNGTILNLTFTVPEDAEARDYNISLTLISAIDDNVEDVNVKTEAGKVNVIAYVPGDVNDDDKVDIKDVVFTRRYVATGYDVVINEAAADVNADDKVDIKDVVLIRRYVATGYGVEFLN